MFTHPVDRRFDGERSWTAHLATTDGVVALLGAVERAGVPAPPLASLAGATITHQLHLGGRYPDVTVHGPRGDVLLVIEAQRGRVDDKHVAKLAAHYVPDSGARLGILVAERWDPRFAGHPAWAVCPAPVVVVTAHDALHHITYRPVWLHHPGAGDTEVP